MKNLTLALVALLLVPGLALAQDTKQEDAVSAWINTLIAKMDAKDETITRSVDRALSAMGDKALPALEKVAGGEGAKAERARRLVEQIKNPRRGGRGGRGGERGGRGGRGGEGGGRGGFGGRGGQGRRRGGFGRRDPFEGIEVNEETKKKLDALQAKRNEERRELFEAMQNGELDRSEIREAMQELSDKMNAEVKKLLTPEQYKKYEENNSRRGGRGGRGGGRGGDGGRRTGDG